MISRTLITNALLHANRLSVWGFFLKKLNQASLCGNQFPNPQCQPSVALCVQGPCHKPDLFVLPDWSWAPGSGEKREETPAGETKSSKGKFSRRVLYMSKAIFLRSCKFLIFYIFLNLGKGDITIESCFQLTSGVLWSPPMYFVIKCFCKCVKCIIIVLPLESLRLRLDRHQEKKKTTKS